jgi:hypothetical protein
VRECGSHLRQQALLQELGDRCALGVQDAIETQIEVGLAKLEQLFQLADQLPALVGIGVLVGGAFRRKAGTGCCLG